MKKYYTRMKLMIMSCTASLWTASVLSVSAASCSNGSPNGVICNPLGGVSDIATLVSEIMGYVVKIGGVLAILAFIYSGYRFVAARGNPKEIEDAKKIFFNTCIGVALLLGAQLISTIVVGTVTGLQS